MTPRTLSLSVLFLAAIAFLLTWVPGSGADDPGLVGRTAAPTDSSVPGTTSLAEVSLAGSGDAPSIGRRAAVETAPLADRRRHERELLGVVVAEDGAPLGEAVRIRYHGSGFASPATASSIVEAREDGTFAVPIPPGEDSMVLDVLADFLALPGPVKVTVSSSTDVNLVVHRGSCIVIDLVGPGAEHTDAQMGADFQVFAARASRPGLARYRAFKGLDGRLRVGGVLPDQARVVGLDAERFVNAYVAIPQVSMGERSAVELPIARGVSASGQVCDAEGIGIAGAQVQLTSWEHSDQQSEDGLVEEVTADDDGQFSVSGVVAGEMTLRVAANGFTPSTQALGAKLDEETVDGLRVVLEGGGSVSGRVVWADGSAAAKSKILLKAVGRSWDGAAETKTDALGAFVFTGLTDTPMLVRASAKPKRSRVEWHSTMEAQVGQTLTLELEAGLSLSGRVVDDRGEGLSKFQVAATPVGQNKGSARITTRQRKGDGSFRLDGLGSGLYDVTASAKGHGASAPIRFTAAGTGALHDLILPRLAHAAGTVVNTSGSVLADVPLRIGGKAVTTDSQGRFEVEGVAPGALAVSLLDSTFGVLRSEPVVLQPGETREDVTIVLARGGRVLGTLHPSLLGSVHRRATLRRENTYSMPSTDIGADGHFRFDGLQAGTYWVALAQMEGVEWTESFRESRPIPIEVPMDADVHVTLGAPGAYPLEIHGSVTRGGEPATGMMMYVYGTESETTFPAVVSRTDDKGEYRVKLRTPGHYTFNVGEGQAAQARFRIEVTSKVSQEHDLVLPERVLRGRAVRTDGSPVAMTAFILIHADAPVDAKQAGELQFAMTRSDGSFEFSGLHAGRYRLHTGNYMQAHDHDGLVIVKDIEVAAEDDVAELHIVVPNGSVVDATVLGPDGSPRLGHSVALVDVDGYPSIIFDRRRTDASGALRFTGVGEGIWTAVARDATGREVGRASVDTDAGSSHEVSIHTES